MHPGGIDKLPGVDELLDLLGLHPASVTPALHDLNLEDEYFYLDDYTTPAARSSVVPGGIDRLLGIDELDDRRRIEIAFQERWIEAMLGSLHELLGIGDATIAPSTAAFRHEPLPRRPGRYVTVAVEWSYHRTARRARAPIARPWSGWAGDHSARNYATLLRGRRDPLAAKRTDGRLPALWRWRAASRAAERRRQLENKPDARQKAAASFNGLGVICLPVVSLFERAVQVLAHLDAFWRSAWIRRLTVAARRLAGVLVRRALTLSQAASSPPVPPGRLVTSCARLLRGPNRTDRTRICPFGGAAAA